MKKLFVLCVLAFVLLLHHQAVRVAHTPTELDTPLHIPVLTYTPVKPLTLPYETVAVVQLVKATIAHPSYGGEGYDAGNCTYGVALWRAAEDMPIDTGWGNAKDWAAHASAEAVPVGDRPEANAIAVSQHGEYGHVMLVEAVYPNGSFLVKEQNYDYQGSIRERVVDKADDLRFIYF